MEPSPITCSDDETRIDGVAFADTGVPIRITLSGGRVSDISASSKPAEWVVLPPLVDEHVHANRAFTLGATIPESFDHAVQMTLEMLAGFSADQYAHHAERLFAAALRKGTTGIRTHADVDKDTQLRATEGTLRARASVEDRMDVDVVAFASSRADPAKAETEDLLRDAIAMGCSYLGGVPVHYADPRRSIDRILELAMELDVSVDLHQDEHLDANNSWSEYLADAVVANDFKGRVFLSHGCALSALKTGDRQRVIDKLVDARITVIVLPLTNLYLQNRGCGTPLLRGITSIHELLDAGVPVRIGSDNVCDAFFPYGNADLLDAAFVTMLAGQVDRPSALVAGICRGQSRLAVDDSADLVIIKGSSFAEIISHRPPERIIIRNGVVVTPS